MGGWFKFHRDWMDDPVINKDADYLRVWIELHKMAAFDDSREVDFKGQRLRLKPGQLTTGRYQLAQSTGIHPSKVQRIIERFKSDHLIEHQRSSHTSLISICSWNETQKSEQQNEHLSNNCRTSVEHLSNTNKEGTRSIRREDYIWKHNDHPEWDEPERFWSYEKFMEDLNKEFPNG